jgi:hypothetical protein
MYNGNHQINATEKTQMKTLKTAERLLEENTFGNHTSSDVFAIELEHFLNGGARHLMRYGYIAEVHVPEYGTFRVARFSKKKPLTEKQLEELTKDRDYNDLEDPEGKYIKVDVTRHTTGLVFDEEESGSHYVAYMKHPEGGNIHEGFHLRDAKEALLESIASLEKAKARKSLLDIVSVI